MSFVSANVAYVRRRLGYSQAQLADELGIKRSLLGAYEEARATPRFDVLEKLEKLSGHSPSDLLNRRLMPEGYQPPPRRGRSPGQPLAPRLIAPTPAPRPVGAGPGPAAPAPEPGPPAYAPTLTLTVDTAGQPQASLVRQGELARYGSQNHSAAYVAALPTLTLPMLEAGQAYRAFEVQAGQIHICRLVRNWAGIEPSDKAYVLAYRTGVAVASPVAAGRGVAWNMRPPGLVPARQEEPLEVWLSEWVLTQHWQPLPVELGLIAERLAALEEKLG